MKRERRKGEKGKRWKRKETGRNKRRTLVGRATKGRGEQRRIKKVRL